MGLEWLWMNFRNASLRTKLMLAFAGLIGLAGIPGVYSIQTFQNAITGLRHLREGTLEADRLVREISESVDACQSKEVKLRVLRTTQALDSLDGHFRTGRESISALFANPVVLADPALQFSVGSLSRDWDTYLLRLLQEGELVKRREWPAAEKLASEEVIPLGKSIASQVLRLEGRFKEQSNALTVDLESRARQAATLNTYLFAVGLLAALLLTPLLSERLTRPIRRLKIRALRMSKGDFGDDVPVESEDEMGKLTRAFNYMQSQLKELDRMKSEFISIASHELRNPIMVLTGYASMIHSGRVGEVPGSMKEAMDIVQRESDRLLRLVDRLLDISKIESGNFQLNRSEIDPSKFSTEMAEAFRGAEGIQKIRFRHSIAPRLPHAFWDGDRIREAVDNLLSNACKFTPDGGEVRLDVAESDEGIAFSVTDTGPGIPADKLDRIFDKFYQIDRPETRRSKGVGLGLALAKGIVEAHGGTIDVISEVGKGSTFRMTFPLLARDLEVPAGTQPEKPRRESR